MDTLEKVVCHRCQLHHAKSVCTSCNKPICLACTYILMCMYVSSTIASEHILEVPHPPIRLKVCGWCYHRRHQEDVRCKLQPDVYVLN